MEQSNSSPSANILPSQEKSRASPARYPGWGDHNASQQEAKRWRWEKGSIDMHCLPHGVRNCASSYLGTVGNESIDKESVVVKQGGHLGWSLQRLRGISAELLPLDRDRVAARGAHPGHLGFYLQ